MGKENVIVGVIGIVIGISIYAKTHAFWPSLAPTLIGLALILFSKEEGKIERRKDKK